MPGSLYAICRAHRRIDGLRGWRMRSQAYFTLFVYMPSVCSKGYYSHSMRDQADRGSIVILGEDCSSSLYSLNQSCRGRERERMIVCASEKMIPSPRISYFSHKTDIKFVHVTRS